MENSIFWSKKFIPVYFIVAFLSFALFKFYIQTDNYSVYILIILVFGLGIASC
ncbi:hypothetical protein, partial [Staphylococcus cohnii]